MVTDTPNSQPSDQGAGPDHTETETHGWTIDVPDHPTRQDSPEYVAARRQMNEIASQATGLIYGPGPFQDHHGGALWASSRATAHRRGGPGTARVRRLTRSPGSRSHSSGAGRPRTPAVDRPPMRLGLGVIGTGALITGLAVRVRQQAKPFRHRPWAARCMRTSRVPGGWRKSCGSAAPAGTAARAQAAPGARGGRAAHARRRRNRTWNASCALNEDLGGGSGRPGGVLTDAQATGRAVDAGRGAREVT